MGFFKEYFPKNLNLDWYFSEQTITAKRAQKIVNHLKNFTPVTQDLAFKKSVCFKDCILEDEAMEILAKEIGANKGIKALFLLRVQISNTGIQSIAKEIKASKSLLALGIQDSGITTEGVEIIANALTINKSLTFLSLSSNKIGDKGAIEIAEALKGQESIKNLVLYNNNISDVGGKAIIEALEFNKSLETLDIEKNDSISTEIKQAIQQMMTPVEIHAREDVCYMPRR